MKSDKNVIRKRISSAIRSAAASGKISCVEEILGCDEKGLINEIYLIDTKSVPRSGPISMVIYSITAREAWEIELKLSVRDVANQPIYEELFKRYETWCNSNDAIKFR